MAGNTDIIIVGAGASGLMAAITAVEHGMDTLLLEQQEKPGRKLSATGNGKCNFTNRDMKSGYFFQADGEGFVKKALSEFPPEKVTAFFEESGIAVMEKNGYYYPMSGQADLVRDALLFRFLHGKAAHKCKCSCLVTEIRKEQGMFCVHLSTGYEYKAARVILSCGSVASPQLGGSALGIDLAKQLGHTALPMLPALCGLKTSCKDWQTAAGVRVMAELFLYREDRKCLIGKEYGELQITDYGISGIPVFQLSGQAVRLLEKKISVMAVIDFFPQKKAALILREFLEKQRSIFPEKSILSALSGIFPEKLAKLLLIMTFGKQKKNRQETRQIQEIGKEELQKLLEQIHQFQVPITGDSGFSHAQAASGGVSTKQICMDTMESKLVSGLYFSGEMIDVVGICGGYNLQFAWASGYLAGKSAAESMEAENRL